MLETSSNSLNSHHKILQKNPDFRLVEFSFRLVKQELSSDRDIQKLQDFFFTISIDRAKASTNQKCLTSNFHLKNSLSGKMSLVYSTCAPSRKSWMRHCSICIQECNVLILSLLVFSHNESLNTIKNQSC